MEVKEEGLGGARSDMNLPPRLVFPGVIPRVPWLGDGSMVWLGEGIIGKADEEPTKPRPRLTPSSDPSDKLFFDKVKAEEEEDEEDVEDNEFEDREEDVDNEEGNPDTGFDCMGCIKEI